MRSALFSLQAAIAAVPGCLGDAGRCMAACEEKRARGNMEAPEGNGDKAEQGVNLPAKTKSFSARFVSPYAKRSATQRQGRKTSSNANAGAISRTSKARITSRSPSHKPTCTSAPATIVRLPGARQPATNPSPKAKQGTCSVSIGVPGERRSAPLTKPHHQKQASYVMVPVRLKKAGLKLLDPEKVKNLTSLAAAMRFESGEESLHTHVPQAGKPCSLNSRHKAVLRFPAKQIQGRAQTAGSRTSTGILGSRPNSNPSTKQEKASGDHESHLLTHQMDGLLINEKDGSESGSCNTSQESRNSHTSPQPITKQQIVIQHDEIASTDRSSLEASNNNDPLDLLTFQTMSTKKEEDTFDIVNENVKEKALDFGVKTKVTQGQLLEEDKESYSELHLSSKENHESVGLQHEEASDDLIQSRADFLNDPEAHKSGEIQIQEDSISSHGHLSPKSQMITSSHHVLKKTPRTNDVDTTDERCVSFPVQEDPSPPKVSINPGQSSSLAEETMEDMGLSNNQEDIKSPISSSRNDVIRKSQGVLVLTRSTDENAIFIPKLKFEFTPDNSIDWTTLRQSLTGDQVKEKYPILTKPCTPRGPSFSKSVLKKSSALHGSNPTAGGNSETNPRSFGAERSSKDSFHPLHGIVDLSISFQGKYEGDEIPKDIPKILLMEEDSDED